MSVMGFFGNNYCLLKTTKMESVLILLPSFLATFLQNQTLQSAPVWHQNLVKWPVREWELLKGTRAFIPGASTHTPPPDSPDPRASPLPTLQWMSLSEKLPGLKSGSCASQQMQLLFTLPCPGGWPLDTVGVVVTATDQNSHHFILITVLNSAQHKRTTLTFMYFFTA